MSRQKAHSEETIAKIRQEYAQGKTTLELAVKYHVHYRTITNYCRGVRENDKSYLHNRNV